MLHDVIVLWFERLLDWGYTGIFLMMAIESTIVPLPSELVIPPAAYWAAQGDLSFWGVVLSGASGSAFGSSLCYGLTYTLGRAAVLRWGRLFLVGPDKVELAERWIADYALSGVFFARLLPVLRHLVGFSAGLVRVPFRWFLLVTFSGSFLWCTVLAWVGANTIGKRPDLLHDPEAMASVLKANLGWFVGLAFLLSASWIFVKWWGKRSSAKAH